MGYYSYGIYPFLLTYVWYGSALRSVNRESLLLNSTYGPIRGPVETQNQDYFQREC